jgi:phage/conjugal plasmid C-4 type zinc finger TraR family protein
MSMQDNGGRRGMATGWAHEGAVLEQIEDTITDGVLSARARLPVGDGADHCDDCGDDIPQARRRALPSARTCVSCQSERDSKIVISGINRRGSKDSQLK